MSTFIQMVECRFKVHLCDLYSTSQVQQFEEPGSNLMRINSVRLLLALGALCCAAYQTFRKKRFKA